MTAQRARPDGRDNPVLRAFDGCGGHRHRAHVSRGRNVDPIARCPQDVAGRGEADGARIAPAEQADAGSTRHAGDIHRQVAGARVVVVRANAVGPAGNMTRGGDRGRAGAVVDGKNARHAAADRAARIDHDRGRKGGTREVGDGNAEAGIAARQASGIAVEIGHGALPEDGQGDGIARHHLEARLRRHLMVGRRIDRDRLLGRLRTAANIRNDDDVDTTGLRAGRQGKAESQRQPCDRHGRFGPLHVPAKIHRAKPRGGTEKRLFQGGRGPSR